MGIKNKFRNMPLAAKASIVYLMVSILQKGMAFLTSPLYTRLLTTEEFGQVTVYLSWQQLFGIVAMFCLSAGVFDVGMLEYKTKREEFVFSLLILSNLISLVSGLCILALYPVLKTVIGLDIPLLLVMFATFFTQPAFLFWTRQQRFEYRYRIPSIVTLLLSVLAPAAAILCIVYGGDNKVYGRIFGFEIVSIAVYLIFYGYLLLKSKGRLNTAYWGYAVRFNLPLIPHYLSSYVLNSSDRIMISALSGSSDAALYGIAYSIAAVITIVWSAVNSSLVPYTYEKFEQKEYESVSKITNSILTIYAVICLFVIVLAPEALKILATAEYSMAVYVIPPIVGGVFFQTLYYVFSNVLYYYKKPKFVMIGSIITAALNLILNYIFIPLFGFIAAGYTTLICYMLQALIDYLAMRKVAGIAIYNIRYLRSVSGIVILISLLSNFLYGVPYIRYSILLVILLAVVWKRSDIIAVMNNTRKR